MDNVKMEILQPVPLDNQVISKGEWGQKLLQSIHDEVELFYTAKGPETFDVFFECLVDCCHLNYGIGFANSAEMIARGALAGEPELMYLMGGLLENCWCSDNLFEYLDRLAGTELNRTASDWYILAANAGSERARLWCAYCMDTGQYDFEQDHNRSEKMLCEVQKLPDTLAFPELSFLAQESADMHAKADYIYGIEETIESSFGADNDEYPMPDPGYFTLHRRSDNIVEFMALLGLPDVITAPSQWPGWPEGPEERAIKKIENLKVQNERWLKWCHEKGLEIKLM